MKRELGPKTAEELQAAALELIGIIYEAAVNPERWQDFLRIYGQLYPGCSQYLWMEDRDRSDFRVLIGECSDRSFLTSFEAHYGSVNPWTECVFSQPEGHVHLGDWQAPRAVLESSEFYHDWLKPQDLHDGFGSTILKSDRHMMSFSILHSKRVASLERDLELLKLIVPHMQRAARLHGHFLDLQGRAGTREELLNQLTVGAVLCDGCGRIQHMNKAAQDMVLAGDGLCLIGGRLVPAVKTEADRLDRLLKEAAGMVNGGPVTTGGALSVSRPSGRRAYGLTVAPYRGQAPNSPWVKLAPSTRVVLFIADPELRQPPPESLLTDLYGLTAAEARMAAQLSQGRSLDEVAEVCEVTRETARSRLKQLFSKTGTHSQSELVALLLRSLPPTADGRGSGQCTG